MTSSPASCARKPNDMTRCEAQLMQLAGDAISMLRWQTVKPLGSATWAEWIIMAVEVIDSCVNQPAIREMFEGDL